MQRIFLSLVDCRKQKVNKDLIHECGMTEPNENQLPLEVIHILNRLYTEWMYLKIYTNIFKDKT